MTDCLWLQALESQLGKATEAQGSIFELLQEYRKCRYGDEDDDGEVKEPPTKEEVHEYAAYLNFDLSLNPQLEWLAAEAIVRLLPNTCLDPKWTSKEGERFLSEPSNRCLFAGRSVADGVAGVRGSNGIHHFWHENPSFMLCFVLKLTLLSGARRTRRRISSSSTRSRRPRATSTRTTRSIRSCTGRSRDENHTQAELNVEAQSHPRQPLERSRKCCPGRCCSHHGGGSRPACIGSVPGGRGRLHIFRFITRGRRGPSMAAQ